MRNLVGEIFGQLVAIRPTSKRSGSYVIWLCQCTCGNRVEVRSSNLRSGNTKSCGCRKGSNQNAGKVYCPQGHMYTEENTYVNPTTGGRQCRTCQRNQRAINEAKRRACKLSQTPELTTEEQQLIDSYYGLSSKLGLGWQVDHIVPLSRNGLHHPNNLQIILAEDNRRKHCNKNYRPSLTVRLEKG